MSAVPTPVVPPPTVPSTGPGTADLSCLDAQALERLRALDPNGASGLLERVLLAFHGSAQRLLQQMRDARHTGDAGSVRHVAHTLKSSAASIGALRLSQLCAEVELVLRQGGLESLGDRLDALDREARQVLAALAPLATRAP